jgi:hypothetical protein
MVIHLIRISPSDSVYSDPRPVVVALALLSRTPSLDFTVPLMTLADQILNRNLYLIVSSTAAADEGDVLNQISNSDTPSFAPAGFGRNGHFRHCWLVWGLLQWAEPARTLVL